MLCKLYLNEAIEVTKMQTIRGKTTKFEFTLFVNNVNYLILIAFDIY